MRAFQTPRCHLEVGHPAPPGATGEMFIDLVQWVDPPSEGGPYPSVSHVAINRVAFRVSDVDATTATLRERGITFLRGIATTDPDGVFVQFVQGL